MNATPEILGIGEVLWDLLPNGPRLGGAPCNFAFHCRQLGHAAAPVSRVGAGELGLALRQELHALDLPTDFVQIDDTHPTGTVRVDLDAGQPKYTIADNVAYDFLAWDDRFPQLLANVRAVCFGTLAQRNPGSRATIRRMLKETQAVRVFDVNLRQHFYVRDTIDQSLRLSNWVKLNTDELEVLTNLFGLPRVTPSATLTELRSRYRLSLVCLTRGEHGCLVQTDSEEVDQPGVPVRVVDTVGAGDAFTAGLVCLTLENRSLRDAAALANRLAARVASMQGGTPRIDRSELE
jgi:fructokinase